MEERIDGQKRMLKRWVSDLYEGKVSSTVLDHGTQNFVTTISFVSFLILAIFCGEKGDYVSACLFALLATLSYVALIELSAHSANLSQGVGKKTKVSQSLMFQIKKEHDFIDTLTSEEINELIKLYNLERGLHKKVSSEFSDDIEQLQKNPRLEHWSFLKDLPDLIDGVLVIQTHERLPNE